MNIGIFAQTKEGITPATISILRSKVTAEETRRQSSPLP